MTATKLITAEELWELPDDGWRYELVRGELMRMPPAMDEHGEVAATALILIGVFVRQHALGRVYAAGTGFLIGRDPDTVRAPDAAFIATARLPAERQRAGYLPLAPDLVVEVVSPSDRSAKARAKVADWLDAGVRLVWVVEPRRRVVTVYTPDRAARVLTDADELDGGEALPGFRVAVAALFA